jgi:biopolymer transport protein ExbD
MDLYRLRLLVAPGLASLFLVLSLCAIMVQRPTSMGIRVPVMRLHHDSNEPYDCGDGRIFLARLTRDDKTWINQNELPADRLAPTVAALTENGAERVVYVVVDSEVSYGRFAGFLDKIAGATDDLHIVMISGEIRKALDKRQLDLCDFVYPSHELNPD